MKTIICAVFLAAFSVLAFGQSTTSGAGLPSNPCFVANQTYLNTLTGDLYTCPSYGGGWNGSSSPGSPFLKSFGAVTAGHIPVYSDSTGKTVQDGGTSVFLSPPTATAGTALNAAIAASTGGSILVISCGSYTLDTTLNVSQSVELRGAKFNCVTLTLASGVNAAAVNITANYVTLQNLIIDANQAGQGGAPSNGVVLASQVHDIRIFDSNIKNAGNSGLFGTTNSNVFIQRNSFSLSNLNQIQLIDDSSASPTNLWITDNNVDGSAATAAGAKVSIYISTTSGTGNFNGVYIERNTVKFPLATTETDGIVYDGASTANPATQADINNNLVIATGVVSTGTSNGIEIAAITGYNAGGNIVTNSQTGILIETCGSCTAGGTAIGNSVINALASNTGVGIYVQNPYTIVSDNIVQGYNGSSGNKDGIVMTSAALYSQAIGNILTNNNHHILAEGNYQVVASNVMTTGVFGIVADVNVTGLNMQNNQFFSMNTGFNLSAATFTASSLCGNIFSSVTNPYLSYPLGGNGGVANCNTLGLYDATAQTANVGPITVYAVPANGAGMYRASCYVVLTTVGTTSTLPSCSVGYTDSDSGVAQTLAMSSTNTGNTLGLVGAPSTGIGVAFKAKLSTNITATTAGYASTGTAMQYAVHVRVEYISN